MMVSILHVMLFAGGLLLYLSALPPGVPRLKSSALASQVASKWKQMSAEEKTLATCEGLQELEGHREMKALAPHNVPVNVFHDARKTLQGIEAEVISQCSHSHNVTHIYVALATCFACPHWSRSCASRRS